jgi:hypothetical protein
MVEFALVLPVFILFVLGIVQVSLIFVNCMMLKYDAYEIARVAVVYGEDARQAPAQKAERILKLFGDVTNNYNGDASGILKGAATSSVKSVMEPMLAKYTGDGLKIDNAAMESSTAQGAGFLRIMVSYNMPLNVPVVNKLFGFFQKSILNIAGNISGCPFYTIRVSAFMRVEQW